MPAKTMLCGEYDILTAGGEAIALALNSYLQVFLTTAKQPSAQITVASDYWGDERIITADKADDDLLTVLVKELILPLNKVQSIKISSQYLPSYGFGSSSALILALQTAKACIAKLCGRDSLTFAEKNTIMQQAHGMQLRFQAQASGYDIATQWHGGLLKLQTAAPGQLNIQELPIPNHLQEILHIYVSDKGASTPETLHSTSNWIDAGKLQPTIRRYSSRLLASFTQALQRHDSIELSELIAAIAAWRRVFATSPCFPTSIATLLTSLQGCDKTWTFKTSGAGGEDALLLIGQRQFLQSADDTLRADGWRSIAYQPDTSGLAVASTSRPNKQVSRQI